MASSERYNQVGFRQFELLHEDFFDDGAWTCVVCHHSKVGDLVDVFHFVQESNLANDGLFYVVNAEVL